MELRVGLGYDAHALEEAVPLVLGGVAMDYPRGLAGHSDGDVIAHALIDAILGAANLGDIGTLFPSGDEQYRGASSLDLLWEAYREVREAGWELVNADCVLIGEEPRIGDVRDEMSRAARRRARRGERADRGACDDDGPPRVHGPRRRARRAGRGAAAAMKVVRYADRPDLLDIRFDALTAKTFPEYMNHNEPGRNWGRLYTDFPDFQVGPARRRGARRRSACDSRSLGRDRRRPPVRLGRGIRCRHGDERARDRAHGHRHQRGAESAGPAAVEPDDRDLHGQRPFSRAREWRDRSGSPDVEGALPAHPHRGVHGVASARREPLRPVAPHSREASAGRSSRRALVRW